MTQPTTPSTAATGQQPAAPAAEPKVDYDALLDSIPPEYLRKHRRVGGIVGGWAQEIAERNRAQDKTAAEAKAIREQEQAMIDLAQSNPFEFTQKWLGDKAQDVAKREFSELESRTQKTVLDAIGQAYGQVPEWKELTQAEFADVAARTAGLSGPELIAAFNAAALDKVADKRADKRTQAQLTERMKTEREAWEREAAAARLQGEPVPGMSRAQTMTGRFNPAELSEADFKAWYESQMLR